MIYNIDMLNKARNETIKFFGDYSLTISDAKNKATKGTGLNISTQTISSKITNSSCTSKSWQ